MEESIHVNYSSRAYDISINEKKRADTIVIHSNNDILAARLTPNGGNYSATVKLTTEGTIKDNNREYGWVAPEYLSHLPRVLEIAREKARKNKTIEILTKAQALTQQCLENVV